MIFATKKENVITSLWYFILPNYSDIFTMSTGLCGQTDSRTFAPPKKSIYKLLANNFINLRLAYGI